MKALVKPLVSRLRRSKYLKAGQTLVEYVMIMAILSVCAVAVYGLLDAQIAAVFSGIANILDTAQTSH